MTQNAPPRVLTAQEAVARLVALEAEIVRLRAGIAELRIAHHSGHAHWTLGGSWTGGTCPKCITEWRGIWGPAVCTCGADAHNGRIDALLGDPDGR